jgi:hypothetical protein
MVFTPCGAVIIGYYLVFGTILDTGFLILDKNKTNNI